MIDINEMTVLIADDIPNMITTLRNMMKVLKYGKRFIPADNGEEAWRILKKGQEEPVELAILDYNMPVMNGAELLSRIREDRGLTFCRMAVQAHRGKIGVKAEDQKGSRFWFALPLDMK